MLNIENLTFGYDQRPIYRGQFFCDSGTILHINGPNGTGKTTLLKTLAGLLPTRGGKILFQMKDITTHPAHQRPITLMFPKDNLFPGLSVEENLTLVPGMSMHTYRELIETFAITPLLPLKPRQLSTGQQQLVTFIRCFLHNQDLWLLDEPTSHMANTLADAMIKRLAEYCQQENKHIIVVSHDDALFRKHTNDCRDISSIVQLVT